MKRIALAALTLAALTFSPSAAADHGHNCVWSGGGWAGQGLRPGMPGYDDPHGEPTSTPEPTVTSEPTTPPATPSPTSTAPSPTSTAPAPTATTPAPTSTSTPTSTSATCVWSSGQWLGVNCPGQPTFPAATPSTSTTTPAPVVGPLVETDIVLYAPEVNPARILR